MGSNSRVKRSLNYSFLLSFSLSLCLITYQRPAHAVIPALLGLAKLYDQAVANRALQLSEAEFSRKMFERLQSMDSVLNRVSTNEITTSFSNTGWQVGNSFAWGAVANAIVPNLVTLNDLQVSDETEEIKYISDGVPNGDGTYQVNINGNIETVQFLPTLKNPVIVKIDKTDLTPSLPNIEGVSTGYSLPENALYYAKSSSTNLYHYGVSSTVDIAKSYFQDVYSNQTSYKPLLSKLYGSNATYEYVKRAYIFDFNHSGTDKGSSFYPDIPSYANIVGLPISTQEIFNVTIRQVSYDPNYIDSLCTVDYSTGERVKTCEAPEPMNLPSSMLISDFKSNNSHLVFSDTTESNYSLIFVNTSYFPATKNYIYGSTADMLNNLALLAQYKIPVSDLTKLLNALMMNAVSTDGYDGLPFSSSNLFTDADIQKAINDIGYHPTLLDWYSSATDSSGNLKLNVSNVYYNFYHFDNGGGDNTDKDLNWGEFEPPELEAPPENLFDSYDDLFPFLRDFSIEEKSVACPIYHFDAFGSTFTIDSHCPLLEQNRSLVSLIMMIVWAFASLRIILKA